MRYEEIGPSGTQREIAILCPVLNRSEVKIHYYDPYLSQLGKGIYVFNLFIDKTKKKTSAADIKEYLEDNIPSIENAGVKLLVVTHPDYFKVLTKKTKTDATIGDIFKSVIGKDLYVTYCPNYSRIFHDPYKITDKIKLSLESVIRWMNGDSSKVGSNIIKLCYYPKSYEDIKDWLNRLISLNCDLTCDIEAFSLKHYNSGIGTITFCWNEFEGISFPIDYGSNDNIKIRKLLKDFFIKFKHKIIYHNVCFDVYILIYQLFMNHILDQKGLLDGLNVMLKNWDCTQIITYLATNTCAGNELSLKAQAQEFAGNYAKDDIKDITKIPLDELLEYNLIDGLSTWYVYKKNYPIMVKDDQLGIYNNIFKKAVIDVIQMQLTGLPVNMQKVIETKLVLETESEALLEVMSKTSTIKDFIEILKDEHVITKNASYKKKVITKADIKPETIEFNPKSGPQLQRLLYDSNFLDLPVLDYTDSKQPATGADTLEKLVNHTTNKDIIKFLETLIEYKASAIILSTFLPAMLNAQQGSDGWFYLFGNFKLGGTVSGRESSSSPNLQNLPSTGSGNKFKARLAKLIKSCFSAPPGWLFVGLDFDSLEDKISAVTTRDPNKIKVYSDGYDGHCLRAYYYFKDKMPDIEETVESINSIKKRYPDLRQESKTPTFALTYNGTFITLMNNVGLSEEVAKKIERNYHELYKVSDEWISNKIKQASKLGYVTVAFGLRLRTPLLKQSLMGIAKTPKEASQEARTAGNALGQSWCMLNNRAASEFMYRVREEEYKLDIKPCAHIHDAQYYLIRDDIDVLLYTNTHLSKAVQWQEDPLIQNEHIKMSGKLEIFYPNWTSGFDIPNETTEEEVKQLIKMHTEELKK